MGYVIAESLTFWWCFHKSWCWRSNTPRESPQSKDGRNIWTFMKGNHTFGLLIVAKQSLIFHLLSWNHKNSLNFPYIWKFSSLCYCFNHSYIYYSLLFFIIFYAVTFFLPSNHPEPLISTLCHYFINSIDFHVFLKLKLSKMLQLALRWSYYYDQALKSFYFYFLIGCWSVSEREPSSIDFYIQSNLI